MTYQFKNNKQHMLKTKQQKQPVSSSNDCLIVGIFTVQPAMTDLEYDGEDYLQTETAGKSKNYGECQPEVFDGTAKPKTQTKHTEDDFQKNWERSSERLLDVFKLGSSLNEIQKAHLPPETVRLAETRW